MVICTDYRSKDKFSNRIFLEYLYDNIIPKNDEVEEEIIWSNFRVQKQIYLPLYG